MSISANVDMEPDEEVSKVNADMWKAWRVRRVCEINNLHSRNLLTWRL
jgi:hypothetical protein